MDTYIQIAYVICTVILALVSGLLWSLYAFDLTVSIGWGQPTLCTVLLVVMVWAYSMIQLSSPAHAEILKARLERESASVGQLFQTQAQLYNEASELYSDAAEAHFAGDHGYASLLQAQSDAKFAEAEAIDA